MRGDEQQGNLYRGHRGPAQWASGLHRGRSDLRRKLRRNEPNDVCLSGGEHVMPDRDLHGRDGDAGGQLRWEGGVPGGSDGQLRPKHLCRDGVRGRLFRHPAVRGQHVLQRGRVRPQTRKWQPVHRHGSVHERRLRGQRLLRDRVVRDLPGLYRSGGDLRRGQECGRRQQLHRREHVRRERCMQEEAGSGVRCEHGLRDESLR